MTRPESPETDEASRRFAAACVELEDELDWKLLGAQYCEGDARDFFDQAARANLREAGLRFAGDLAEALASARGHSLYLGAGLFELTPVLCETLVLGRTARAFTLPGREVDELNRSLAAVQRRLGFDLPRYETGGLDPRNVGRCDHGWLVSVLTDPERFPALHDQLYERKGSALATGRGDLGRERERARRLVGRLLDCLAPPCRLTTTDEELGIVGEVCADRELQLEVPDAARLSAIVGDPVRFCRVIPAGRGFSAGSAGRRKRPSARRARRTQR